jgi:hypothetical protein
MAWHQAMAAAESVSMGVMAIINGGGKRENENQWRK